MTRDPEEAAVNDALNELEEDGKIGTEYENGELRHQLTDDGQAYVESPVCRVCSGVADFGNESGTDAAAIRSKLADLNPDDVGLSALGERPGGEHDV